MSCRGGTERDGMMDRRNGERRNVYRMAREATPNNPSSRSSGPATSSFAPKCSLHDMALTNSTDIIVHSRGDAASNHGYDQ